MPNHHHRAALLPVSLPGLTLIGCMSPEETRNAVENDAKDIEDRTDDLAQAWGADQGESTRTHAPLNVKS